ncbi:MAG: hypothetical protein CMO26_13575 [Thiotrichales bacterium]|nr:hypothetical protein [Thiotrichales bacterium]|tara:strand:+ start:435 stop:686 length:252 start_codon:yes stop_codon:yes gene_type:complete
MASLRHAAAWLLWIHSLDGANNQLKIATSAQRKCSDLARPASVGANFDWSTDISVGYRNLDADTSRLTVGRWTTGQTDSEQYF